MRHRVNKAKKIGKGSQHRKKLLKSLASSVIVYEKIETTQSQAKAIRGYVDKMITKGKVKNLHNNRQLHTALTPKAARKVIEVLAERFQDRKGGYTRILISGTDKNGNKKYLVELV